MNKELEDSINMLRNTDISTIENAENIDLLTYSYAVKTVLNYIENSIQKESTLNKEYIDNIPEGQLIGITKLQYKEYLYLRENSIHKKKVEEKIEKIKLNKNHKYTAGAVVAIMNELQELLEEK